MAQTEGIDLRSDTVTQPTLAMREAMAFAQVGDDQYGDDPSINALEGKVAALLGKDGAVFVPSGTMANQIVLRVLTHPGDEVIVPGEAHILWHESGASAINAGVQINSIGSTGLLSADDLRAAFKPRGHIVFPPTALVVVENTHNRGGGIIFPYEDAVAIGKSADELGIASYLDGARLFNAARASNRTVLDLAHPFRMVSISLSKGLGCPVGSVLAGTHVDIMAARRVRRMLGGAMRQAGILAAAGLYALDHHVERLDEDHVNARVLAEVLAHAPGFEVDLRTVQTNIVMFRTAVSAPNAETIVNRCLKLGVLVSQFGLRTIRATTHLNVNQDQCLAAARILVEASQH